MSSVGFISRYLRLGNLENAFLNQMKMRCLYGDDDAMIGEGLKNEKGDTEGDMC